MLSSDILAHEVEQIIKWIEQIIKSSGAKGIVIGNSGGKDSATVIALAVKAVGKENVITLALPCESKTSDLEDAKLVSDTFGVELLEIELGDTYSNLEDNINQGLKSGSANDRISKEAGVNIKPRLRMTALYAIARDYGISCLWHN